MERIYCAGTVDDDKVEDSPIKRDIIEEEQTTELDELADPDEDDDEDDEFDDDDDDDEGDEAL